MLRESTEAASRATLGRHRRGDPPAPPKSGLFAAEAQRRLAEFGPNELVRQRSTALLTLLGRQFTSPVIWLLLGASVLSAVLGELLDASAIGVIVDDGATGTGHA